MSDVNSTPHGLGTSAAARAQDPPRSDAHDASDTSTSTCNNTASFLANKDTRLEGITGPFQTPASIYIRKPSDAGLHLKTDIDPQPSQHAPPPSLQHHVLSPEQEFGHHFRPHSHHALASVHFGSRSSFDTGTVSSPPSSISSPMLSALNDVTPLPSPLAGSMELEMLSAIRASRSRGNSSASTAREEAMGLLSPVMRSASPNKKKPRYPGLGTPAIASVHAASTGHGRTRSTSEFVPETLQNVRPRNITTPGGSVPQAVAGALDAPEQPLHREEFLADRQKKHVASLSPIALSSQEAVPPTPPPSDRSSTEADDAADARKSLEQQFGRLSLRTSHNGRQLDWKPMRLLGRGAFSQVILASSAQGTERDLVAVKIVSHQLQAGSDEERMDTSIKREIEILKSVSHPCLPHLHSYADSAERALLVLNYCPGGDLFEFASQHRRLLTGCMVQRIFAELVDAVAYLHRQYIVHRDIKLENILLNLPVEAMRDLENPQSLASPMITLTDLGLSRRIPSPPSSPLLNHACGSGDYAAPELLLGQAYDGRATDAWALGVVLYALLEGKLPFDPLPGKRNTSNVKHRIARCDWLWCEYGDQWGDWVEDSVKGKEMQGARQCVEGLLKKASRGRWTLDNLRDQQWVQQGLLVDGGLKPAKTPLGSEIADG